MSGPLPSLALIQNTAKRHRSKPAPKRAKKAIYMYILHRQQRPSLQLRCKFEKNPSRESAFCRPQPTPRTRGAKRKSPLQHKSHTPMCQL